MQTIVNLPKLVLLAALWLVVPLLLALLALAVYLLLMVNPDLGQAAGVGIIAYVVCILAGGITFLTIGD